MLPPTCEQSPQSAPVVRQWMKNHLSSQSTSKWCWNYRPVWRMRRQWIQSQSNIWCPRSHFEWVRVRLETILRQPSSWPSVRRSTPMQSIYDRRPNIRPRRSNRLKRVSHTRHTTLSSYKMVRLWATPAARALTLFRPQLLQTAT